MAYDAALAERIRDLLSTRPDVTEMRMFGGLAFLVNGHMTIAASGAGGALVRVDPSGTDEFCRRAGVEPMVMRGKPMAGWLHVGAAELRTGRQLSMWVGEALAFTSALPPKPAKRRSAGTLRA